jgi:hypothetical protein
MLKIHLTSYKQAHLHIHSVLRVSDVEEDYSMQSSFKFLVQINSMESLFFHTYLCNVCKYKI